MLCGLGKSPSPIARQPSYCEQFVHKIMGIFWRKLQPNQYLKTILIVIVLYITASRLYHAEKFKNLCFDQRNFNAHNDMYVFQVLCLCMNFLLT